MRVGILGGGQLSQMLAVEAYKLGLEPYILAAKKTDCALRVVGKGQYKIGWTVSNLNWLADLCAVVSLESEFVNTELISKSRMKSKLLPSLKCLTLCQSKLSQKRFLREKGLPTLDFIGFDSLESLDVDGVWNSVVVKRARLGYDGKGVFPFAKLTNSALKKLKKDQGDFEGYVEDKADFRSELSVVIARSILGDIQSFPTVQTLQTHGVCSQTVFPPKFAKSVSTKAEALAKKVISQLKGVGVFGVEMFLMDGNRLVINEIAPRVHNTGHWTLDGTTVSQFEQHWRALLGWPLVTPKVRGATVMLNILGQKNMSLSETSLPMAKYDKLKAQSRIYWYGKTGRARGRKLGHINVVAANAQAALKQAKKVRESIKV